MKGYVPTIGQISRPAATFIMTSCYPMPEFEQVLHRAMLGEKIEVYIGAMVVYVVRNHEFDNWWLVKE